MSVAFICLLLLNMRVSEEHQPEFNGSPQIEWAVPLQLAK